MLYSPVQLEILILLKIWGEIPICIGFSDRVINETFYGKIR